MATTAYSLIHFKDGNPTANPGFRNNLWQKSAPYAGTALVNNQVVDTLAIDVSSEWQNIGGVNVQAGTTYLIAPSDAGKLIVFTAAGAVAVTADSTIAGLFGSGTAGTFMCAVIFLGAGGGTVTPSSGTINGASNQPYTTGQSGFLYFNGTNWWAINGATSGGSGGGLNGVSVKTGDYTITSGDNGKLLILSSSAAHTFTLPNPPPSATFCVFVASIGTGVLTVSRNSLTIDGVAANQTIGQFQGTSFWTDASNYFTDGEPFVFATKIGVQNQSYIWATDTGSANAYAIAPSPAIAAYVAGQKFAFIIANTNTAASTVNVSGLGTKSITKSGSLALTGGEMLAGQVAELTYDGTNFQLGGAGTSTADRPDRLASFVPGKPNAGQSVMGYAVAWALTFPANFATPNSYGHCDTNPTATATYTVYKNGSNIGTITISTGGVFTFATAGGTTQSANAGDFIEVVAPGSQDATLANVGFTLVGTRTAAVPTTIGQGIFTYRFAYNGATSYNVNDVVTYFGQVYVCILPTTGNAPTNGTYWSLCLPNMYGGALTLDYYFSTTTTNSDPGSGNLRLNNATQNTATAFYVNTTDANGNALAALLDTLDVSTNTVKANLRFVKKGDITKWINFNLTSRTTHTGYREYGITNTASSASSPFANSDEILVDISTVGDAGGGATGTQIQNQAFSYGSDGGSANAYTLNPSPAVTSYVNGLRLVFHAANANTGASTFNVSSLGTKNIKKWSAGAKIALSGGEISVGQDIEVTYDGTDFVLGSGSGGGDTTAEYVLGDFDANLANAVKNSTVYRSVDVCPASPNSMNDEFDDTSGNSGTVNGLNARWAWKQQGSVPNATYSNGWAIIAWTGNNGGSHVARIIAQATPSPPYEFICKQTFHPPVGNASLGFGGMFLFESATNKYLQNGFSCQGNALIPYMASGSANINTGSNIGFFGYPVYFKINRTGTTLTYYISCDGISWDQIATRTITNDFTTAPDFVGVGIDPYSQPVGVNTDFFRRTI